MTDLANCSGCGAEFHCGFNDDAKCWCAEYPFVTPSDDLSGCMCPKCLKAYIKETTADFGECQNLKDRWMES
jgi:hypothetical protein